MVRIIGRVIDATTRDPIRGSDGGGGWGGLPIQMEVEVGALVGCSGAIKANPSGVRYHGLTSYVCSGEIVTGR